MRAPKSSTANVGPANALAFTGGARTTTLARSAVIAIAAGILSLRIGRRPPATTPATGANVNRTNGHASDVDPVGSVAAVAPAGSPIKYVD